VSASPLLGLLGSLSPSYQPGVVGSIPGPPLVSAFALDRGILTNGSSRLQMGVVS